MGLQGLAIFLLHVAFNDLAKKHLRSYLRRKFHILEFHSLSRNTTVKSTMRSRGQDRGGGGQSDVSFVEMSSTSRTVEITDLTESCNNNQTNTEDAAIAMTRLKRIRRLENNNNLVYPLPEPEPDY